MEFLIRRIIMNLLLFMLLTLFAVINADEPCAARRITGRSVVCVCNSTYCDTITRDAPISGQYVSYTSSEGGLRFQKSNGTLQTYTYNISSECCIKTLEIDPNTKYQTIEGFGAAATDAAGINWSNLSDALQSCLVNSYFSETGLQYNMIRVPIGGSDFSTHAYAYNEFPENDTKLTNFSLSYEDYQYKIPLIKASMQATKTPIHIIATTWSPPVWMKTNHNLKGYSRLKPEYFQTYADYHYKFIEKYSSEGIPIWGITTTNEPTNGILPISRFNCLGWSPEQMGIWIVNNLGPTIRNSTFKDVKIIAVDDQRIMLPLWFNVLVREVPKALDYIDGVAVHYYSDMITPAAVITEVMKAYPEKFIIASEASEGSFPWQREKVELGSWNRAKAYIVDIITDLNHNLIGWLDWNMCLNLQGGPNWAGNYVDSPIIVLPKKGIFVKQPMFYAMGHFSKFIPRGSIRIKVTERKPFLSTFIENVAFLTPNNTIVIVLYNNGRATSVSVKLGNKHAAIKMEARSITTVEFPYETYSS